MSLAMFEARLAQDIRVQQLSLALGEAGFAPAASARRFLAAQLEERSIRELRLPVSKMEAEITVSDDEVKAYYTANQDRFQRPARLQADYVVFDREAVEKQVSVSDDEIRAFYEGNLARFGVPEERQARHPARTGGRCRRSRRQSRHERGKGAGGGASQGTVPLRRAGQGEVAGFGLGLARWRSGLLRAWRDGGRFRGCGVLAAAGSDRRAGTQRLRVHIIQVTGIKPASTRARRGPRRDRW